jgi:flagellar basal-body rod protein FlgG
MTTQMQRMDVTTNNIANVNTAGFKRERVAAQSFTERMAMKIDDPGKLRLMDGMRIGQLNHGVFIDLVHTDFSAGSLRVTSGPLDLALSGPGFFMVHVEGSDGPEERFTRDGMFTLTHENVLVTNNGDRVQGLNGDVIVPNGEITISETGRVYSNNEYVDTLRVVNFENPQSLRQTGDNYFRVTDESVQIDFTGRIEQGLLENSNVNVVREMVEMIALARAYEANSRMVQAHDQALQLAVNQIAARA